MSRRITVMSACGLCGAASLLAQAQPHIEEWSGINTSKYDIDQANARVTILQPDPGVFSFDAHDLTTGEPTDIALITTQTGGVDGTIRVQVAPDPASSRTFGALNVGRIDLRDTAGNRSGELVFLKTSRDVGGLGGLTLSTVSGDLEVGRDLLLAVTTDAVSGDITVGGRFQAIINTDTFGNLTALNNTAVHAGSVLQRQGAYHGNILVLGTLTGTYQFAGDVTGHVPARRARASSAARGVAPSAGRAPQAKEAESCVC